jgi:PadR family transcriptional regulator
MSPSDCSWASESYRLSGSDPDLGFAHDFIGRYDARIMDMSKMDMKVPPLKPVVVHILLALADTSTHGYALMQAVREQSGGSVRISTGSFYRYLGALMRDGLVEEAAGPTIDDPRRGIYYRITPRGRASLARERERLAALVAAVDALRPAPRRGRA